MKKRFLMLLCLLVICAVAGLAAAETVPALSLGETAVTLAKGSSLKLTPAAENVENPKKLKYTWESSDESIVTVKNGTLKGIEGGHAVVSCSTELPDGTTLKATAEVEVTIPVASLKLTSPQPLTIQVGGSVKAEYDLLPENASDKSLDWSSSDESIATVDGEGNITAHGTGNAKITAVTKDGSKKKMQINVLVPTLWCGDKSVKIDQTEGAAVEIEYYGDNWDEDVKVTQKGEFFSYSTEGSGSKHTIQMKGISPGVGTLTINNKKDPKSKIVLDVSVIATAIPIPENQYVLITGANCNGNSVTITVQNNYGDDLREYTFAVIPYNAEGEKIYYTEKIGEEPCYYSFWHRLKSGQSKSFKGKKEYGGEKLYETVDHIEVALDSVRLNDGTLITIPDNAHYWFSSQEKAYLDVPSVSYDTRPDESIRKKARETSLGYTSTLLRSWMKEHYGYQHGGEYICQVTPESAAEKAGLRVGDLIIAIDGTEICNDPFSAEKAKAKMADGQSIVFTVERQGQEDPVELTMTVPPAAGSGEEEAFVNPVYSDEFIALQEKKLAMVPEFLPYLYTIKNEKSTDTEEHFSGDGKKDDEAETGEPEEEIEHVDGYTFISHNIGETKKELSVVADDVSEDKEFDRGWNFYNTTSAHTDFYISVEMQCTHQDESNQGWFWFQYSDLSRVGDEHRKSGEILFPTKIDSYITEPGENENSRKYYTYYDLSSEYKCDDQMYVLEMIRYRGYTSCYINHRFVAGFEDGFDGYFHLLYGVGVHPGGKETTFITDHPIKRTPTSNNGRPMEGWLLHTHSR